MMESNDKHAEIKEKLRSWQEHNLSIMFPLLISGKCSRVQTASEQTLYILWLRHLGSVMSMCTLKQITRLLMLQVSIIS